MKLSHLIWMLPLTLSVGCVQSHRPKTYTVVSAPTPVSTRETVRVYPSSPTTTVVTAPPRVVTSPPTVVTTPSTVITTTPAVVTEVPADLPPTTVASSDNLAMAENIRRLLAGDPSLNSAARDVRISVYNGRLTLTGRTATQAERQRLQSALAGMPGVSRVDDRIQVDLR